MKFKQSSILGFFDSSQKHFIIPVYQRAYAWEEKHWSTLLLDLTEQANSDNSYFYGNILLETIKMDVEYEVIDGQQRLTTLVIFMRSLLNVCKTKNILVDFNSLEQIYLKNSGNIKIRPVEYDRACFDAVIVDNKDHYETDSISQCRIIRAKKYFIEELLKLNNDIILKILSKIATAEITCIEFENKKDSALMFELQNNRGKDLTNMEKLKSYFMYQVYTNSSADETGTNIENISNIFKGIYLTINDLKQLNEDSVLIYHCNAFLKKGYAYRTIEDIKNEYKESANKVQWIKDFSTNLHSTFMNMKKFENANSIQINNLRQLKIPAFAYAFIVKGYHYFHNDTDSLSVLFNILETAIFRYRLINSRADFISRINEILQSFTGDLFALRDHFDKKLNETWYWSYNRSIEYLNGYMYENGVLNYLLWKYEESIQRKGYVPNSLHIEKEQIEHISPKKPTNGEPLETGYDVDENNLYSEEFINNKLNCLGNLMLISGSHNASIGNKPFLEKLKTYKETPLLSQQTEISSFLSEDCNTWLANEINKRHSKILTFAKKRWNFQLIEM